MFIKKITICNLFAYHGAQSVEFRHEWSKNLYCILGDNGKGKTGFIRCAKLLFLGSGLKENAIPPIIMRFVPPQSKVNSPKQLILGVDDEWRGILNDVARKEGQSEYFVSFEGEFEGQEFTLKRSWIYINNILEENLSLNLGEERLEEEVAQDKINTILPPNFVEFFFFDGEEVENIGTNLRTGLREKIEEILQIKPLDIIIKQISEYQKELKKQENEDKAAAFHLEKSQKEKEICDKDIIFTQEKIQSTQREIDEFNEQIKDIELKIEKNATQASSEKERLFSEREHKQEQLQKAKAAFSNSVKSIAYNSNLALLDLVRTEIEKVEKNPHKDDLSAFKKLLPKIDEILQKELESVADKKSISKAIKNLPKNLEKNLNILKSKIPPHATEKIRESFVRLEAFNPQSDMREIIDLKADLKDLQDEIDALKTSEYDQKIRDDLEAKKGEILKEKKSSEEMLDRLQSELNEQNEKSDKLAVTIMELDGNIPTNRIQNELKKLEFLTLVLSGYKLKLIEKLRQDLRGQILDKYKALFPDDNVEQISVDSEFSIELRDYENKIITANQSSGQKQILAMAIFWALSEISKAQIPLIIDTPLARIDEKNRANIITNYYAQDTQVIILPTGGELGKWEYYYAKPHLAGFYEIQNSKDRSHAFIKECDDPSQKLK